ncbi:MAG TPA: alpha/beta fold hydrolase [Candidatus Hydrogenedentes bacterium]|jgi:carboxylesterase|nr:alpha/beta fold hydrolase [Candidatus Hydrogenedentota bacterium]
MGFISTRLARLHDKKQRRHPDSGILSGAEPRHLGAQDAERAVLFIHGFIATPNSFADLPDYVAARGWHVRAMLLPGHGTSPFDFQKVTGQELEDAVLQEVEQLKRRYATVVLVGHSMGGALATIAAAQSSPKGLILVAPYYSVTHRWYYMMRPETWARLASSVTPFICAPGTRQPIRQTTGKGKIILYKWIPLKSVPVAMALAEKARHEDTLRKINMPTLLIHSVNDTVTDPAASKKVYDVIPSPDKTAEWLTRSNHVVFWDYDRDQVKESVSRFLSRWES